MQSINQEENEKIKKNWDNMAKWYETMAEKSTLQGTITCAVMTNMYARDRVLEVACGPGMHSLHLAQAFLKQKGVLVSCDYSGAMVKRVHENYSQEENDYVKVPGNKYFIDTETDYLGFADDSCKTLKNTCDLDAIVSEKAGQDYKKFVFGCQANNEILPFPDGYFDAYLSNLSLMIVHNPKNQIQEAYRVLQQGSAACFTIWGQRENSLQFHVMNTVLANNLSPEDKSKFLAQRSHFYLYDDKGVQLKADLEAAGFKGVKIWEQPINILYRTGKEYLEQFAVFPLTKQGKVWNLSDETVEKMKVEAVEMYDELSGTKTSDLKTFSVAVVLAFKE